MISVDGLTVEFGDRALFKDISFQINEKDRIALMGKKRCREIHPSENPGRPAQTEPGQCIGAERYRDRLSPAASDDRRRTLRIRRSFAGFLPLFSQWRKGSTT